MRAQRRARAEDAEQTAAYFASRRRWQSTPVVDGYLDLIMPNRPLVSY